MAIAGIGLDGIFGLLDVFFGGGLAFNPTNTIDLGDESTYLWYRSGDLGRATKSAAMVGGIFAMTLMGLGLISILSLHIIPGVWLILIGLLSLVKFPVYIFAFVTFLMWLHRGYTNLPALWSDST